MYFLRSIMTNHPPMFARQIEEQNYWNDGFKAGIKEVLNELEKASFSGDTDLESPTNSWAREFSLKIEQKYL